LSRQDIASHAVELAEALLRNIPSGVGASRKDLKLGKKELTRVMAEGVKWTLDHGYGSAADLAHIEDEGCIPHADPDKVSKRAYERGRAQLGTLGAGNHFVEVGYVKTVYDAEAAAVMGLSEGGATVLIHTGSRGLGHQVCDDNLSLMLKASQKYGIELPDRQLCCAPVASDEGMDYMGAMAAAANFAFVNRQMILHWTRETFEGIFGTGRSGRLELVYDVCHNMAKIETHQVEGEEMELCVHRKGATRAFPPGHPAIPDTYRSIGQPVLVPGDMGRRSYVMVGTEAGYRETFGSACHGAGRVLSRRQAKKAAKGRNISREMEDRGIIVRAASRSGIVEEMSDAYKNVDNVVNTLHEAGISRKVAELAPLAVIKG
jgi:tRNA-splicing ligase RtcB